MRKLLFFLIALVILAATAYFFYFRTEEPDTTGGRQLESLTMDGDNSQFNQAVSSLLNSYYELKDAFVAADTARVNLAAMDLVQKSEDLPLSGISADSSGLIRETAAHFAATIMGSSRAVLGEVNIEEKRRELEVISEALWSLTRTVRYEGEKIYYQFCPMAFDDKGAYWISNSPEILNPYFGERMLRCGSVQDSIDYSVK